LPTKARGNKLFVWTDLSSAAQVLGQVLPGVEVVGRSVFGAAAKRMVPNGSGSLPRLL
jgi:hypothetical protein